MEKKMIAKIEWFMFIMIITSFNVSAFTMGGVGNTYFNGTMDDVHVYNRTLTASQIQALYDGRVNEIVSDETNIGDVWSCEVTPNDGAQDGASVLSNNLTIVEEVIGAEFHLLFNVPWNESSHVIYSLGFETNTSNPGVSEEAYLTAGTPDQSINATLAPQVISYWDTSNAFVRYSFGYVPNLPIVHNRSYSLMFMLNASNKAGSIANITINITEKMEAASTNWTLSEAPNTSTFLLTAGTIYGGLLEYNSSQYEIPFYLRN